MNHRPATGPLVAGAVCLLGLLAAAPPIAAAELVFGSFRSEQNARAWAAHLTADLGHEIHVDPVRREDGVWFRVQTVGLAAEVQPEVEAQAAARGLSTWSLREPTSPPPVAAPGPSGGSAYLDFDLGVQTRGYRQRGSAGQDRFQPSVSLRLEYHRSWDDERSSVTFVPFLRWDAVDDERTHADVREFYYSRVGDDWELHLGARQIFWGVTEFNHLVDVINQTDLVENVDGEDKLGQPMAQLSLVRDWGILDLFLLTGFRERTFAGEDGRLRLPLPVDDDARYASGAGRNRLDGALRWSHHIGPVSFGIHHFSGTGRDPRLVPEADGGGGIILVPEYHVIDQTGLDAQAIVGDWAWKLEALTRSGDGDRYAAYTAGFERTLVGVLGSRGDLGLVAEYMYDERDAAAYNTLFEHDLAVGARWRANDLADTSALVGLIWDVETEEYMVSLEASRRLGASWMAVVEGRLFGGADPIGAGTPPAAALDGEQKSRPLQRDDFIQLELTRYF